MDTITSRTSSSDAGDRVATHAFHDLDELLLGPSDLEAMPFEFGCDFASAFDDKHLDVDNTANHDSKQSGSSASSAKPTQEHTSGSRGHKRKSESSANRLAAKTNTSITEQESSNSAESGSSSGSAHVGRWTKKEHELFLEGLRMYGKSWKKISSLVVTRTLVQIRTHAQKYLQKQNKTAMKAASSASTLSSAPSKSRGREHADASPTIWKQSSSFHPIAFPDPRSSSSSFPIHHPSASTDLSSSSASHNPFSLRKEALNSGMSKLDQLLHDEHHHLGDDYYASPTSTDDDLAQWLQHRHLPLTSPVPKRRRTEHSTSSWPIVNPMEAMHSNIFGQSDNNSQSHYHQPQSLGVADFLPPLSSYASNNNDGEYTFGHGWM